MSYEEMVSEVDLSGMLDEEDEGESDSEDSKDSCDDEAAGEAGVRAQQDAVREFVRLVAAQLPEQQLGQLCSHLSSEEQQAIARALGR